MNVGTDVKMKLKSRAAQIGDLLREKKELEQKMNDPTLAPEYKQNKIFPRFGEIRVKIGNLQNATQNECKKVLDEYRAQLRKSNRLKSEEITDDARLFSLGVALPVEEVEEIFDRSEGNNTMQRLAMLYAEQHNLQLNRVQANNIGAEFGRVTDFENTVNMYIDHWIAQDNAADMLEKFFPEGE